MKRIFVFLIVFAMLFSGCDLQTEELPENPEASSDVPEKEPLNEEELRAFLRENFPEIDGSTSLIPLEAGIRAVIFEKTFEEATEDVEHSGTWTSFYNLLEGDTVDMIFSCPLSEEQYKAAEVRGITLEAIPVAYEGFVFVVNANNPVDELTQDEIRKIYSGEITNWKELGGNNAEIIAYQRNNDSGSQNYMIEFMGDVPLMDAPEEGRPSSMLGLMDAVAYNDNAENAIGYSVYAYAADMYGGGSEIKFIKVDGAEVSKNNMAKGEYPLLGYNYAVFDASKPADDPVRRLAEWMQTDEGQLAVANAGYVTLRDIGFEYTEKYIPKYSATGAGTENPEMENPSYEYRSAIIPLREKNDENGEKIYYLDVLSDKNLEKEVNDFIEESMKICESKEEQMKAEFEHYTHIMRIQDDYEPKISVSAKNGYLSVSVIIEYFDFNIEMAEGCPMCYHAETAVWDMISGKRLSTEELFHAGTDIAKVLNEFMELAVYQDPTTLGTYYPMKADFMGMPEEGWSITADKLCFEFDNPYFEGGAVFNLDVSLDDPMVTAKPREMADCFSGNVETYKIFRMDERNIVYKKVEETQETIEKYGTAYGYAVLRGDYYPTADVINARIEKYINKNFKREIIAKELEAAAGKKTTSDESLYFPWDFPDAKIFGGKYFFISNTIPRMYLDNVGEIYYSKNPTMIFDIETGKQIEWTEMLTPEGRERMKELGYSKENYISNINMNPNMDYGKLTFVMFDEENNPSICVSVEEDEIRW